MLHGTCKTILMSGSDCGANLDGAEGKGARPKWASGSRFSGRRKNAFSLQKEVFGYYENHRDRR